MASGVSITDFQNNVYDHPYVQGNIVCSSDIECDFNLNFEFVDFDKVKTKFCCNNKIKSLSSCDCLKIHSKKEYIDFIEFKTFNRFIEYNNLKNKSIGNAQKHITKQIRKFNLGKKVKDSLRVYNELFCHNCKPLCAKGTEKFPDFFLLIDIDESANPFDEFSLTMTILSDSTSYTSANQDQIENCINRELKTAASEFVRISKEKLEARYL